MCFSIGQSNFKFINLLLSKVEEAKQVQSQSRESTAKYQLLRMENSTDPWDNFQYFKSTIGL